MTQEDKELLLKDLSARLLYGVKIQIGDDIDTLLDLCADNGWVNASYDIDEVKPYLRPMSSMTEAERTELCLRAYAPDEMKTFEEKLYVVQTNAKNAADFFNEHHLDHRGLIEKGLALPALEGMYEIKN